MPGPIKLIVRPSEKNAVLCYAMQQYYLNLIQLFIEVRDMNEEVGLQRLKAVDLPRFFGDSSVKFYGLGYDKGLLLSDLLVHILSKVPNDFYVFNISSSTLFNELNEQSEVDLKFAVVFQVIAYALVESYRNNPQKISQYFEDCLAQCENFPILYFPALLVFMDAKGQNHPLIQLTQAQIQKLDALIQKPEFAQSNFPFVKTWRERRESVDFSVSSSSGNLESESNGNFFRNFLAQIPQVKLSFNFLTDANILQLPKKRGAGIPINFKAFFGAALLALIGLTVGILLANYFPIGIERTGVLFGLFLPSGLALAIMVGVGIIKVIDRFWPLYGALEKGIKEVEGGLKEVNDKMWIMILKGLKKDESPQTTASPISHFSTTFNPSSPAPTSTLATGSTQFEFTNY